MISAFPATSKLIWTELCNHTQLYPPLLAQESPPPPPAVSHTIHAYCSYTCKRAKEKRKQFANNLFLHSDMFPSGLFSTSVHVRAQAFVHSHIGVRECSF